MFYGLMVSYTGCFYSKYVMFYGLMVVARQLCDMQFWCVEGLGSRWVEDVEAFVACLRACELM